MKKTSIYLLSVLVIAVLALSVILPSHRIVKIGIETFTTGFAKGYAGEEYDGQEETPIEIKFYPSAATMLQPSDSIQFADGRRLPFVINNVVVMAPEKEVPAWTGFAYFMAVILQIVFFIIILWKLIRFILNVSREKIFVIQNVTYLRQISFSMLAIALLQIVGGIVCDYNFSIFHFSWPGYELEAQWAFPWSNLLLGVIGLLFAQVWSYGLQIKQDQELTI